MSVVTSCCCWDISSSFTPTLRWFWCQHCFMLCSRENIQFCWFSLYYKVHNTSKDGASTASISLLKFFQCSIILWVIKHLLWYKYTSEISSHLLLMSNHGEQEGDKWAEILPYPCAVAQAPGSCSLVLLIHLSLPLTLETSTCFTRHLEAENKYWASQVFELRNIEAVKKHQQPNDKMYGLAGLPQHCDHFNSFIYYQHLGRKHKRVSQRMIKEWAGEV